MNRNELSNAAAMIQDAYHYALAARTAKAQAKGRESALLDAVDGLTKAQILALAVDRATKAGMPLPAKYSRHTFFKLVEAWADATGLDANRGCVLPSAWAAAAPKEAAAAALQVGQVVAFRNALVVVVAPFVDGTGIKLLVVRGVAFLAGGAAHAGAELTWPCAAGDRFELSDLKLPVQAQCMVGPLTLTMIEAGDRFVMFGGARGTHSVSSDDLARARIHFAGYVQNNVDLANAPAQVQS